MLDIPPVDNSEANKLPFMPARTYPLLSCPCSPVGSASSGGKIQEMNDRTRAADERRRKNGGDDEKERDLDQKISPRFGMEIVATDVQERRPRTAGGTTVITVER